METVKNSSGKQNGVVGLDELRITRKSEMLCGCWSSGEKTFFPISSCLMPSRIVPRLSRPSSFYSLNFGKFYWKFLIAVSLLLLHATEAYVSVSMIGMCKHNGSKSLRLLPETAISLLLEASNSIHSSCRIELIAPDTHSISLLFTRRKTNGEKKTESSPKEESKVPKCPLIVSFPLLRPEEVKMCLDLCSEDAFTSVENFTDLLPSRVTLEWIPSVKNSNEILASEFVVAAVGRGREICSQPDQFSCRSIGYPIYCISKKLTCDGKRNCPFEGRDEDKEMCESEETYEKVGFGLGENSQLGRGWEFIASEFLKKLSSKNISLLKKSDLSHSTEKSTVLWSDEGNNNSRDSESLPDVLKHYGPWGYLMLGMLICGTVLMFCGLWECCCRRPKALVSNAVGPALLIINQGSQQNEMEAPSTPGPPRYEELDQPPSYSTLFPSSKPQENSTAANNLTTALPITLPLVNSISNLLTNTHSSQTNSSPNFQNGRTNCMNVSAVSPPNVFTIDVQNINCVDISRETLTNEASTKREQGAE